MTFAEMLFAAGLAFLAGLVLQRLHEQLSIGYRQWHDWAGRRRR